MIRQVSGDKIDTDAWNISTLPSVVRAIFYTLSK